jgi:hypothetical protein
VPSTRIDLSAVSDPVTIDPGEYVLLNGTTLEPGAAIWWRRSGFVRDLQDLDPQENLFRRQESEALLLGGLLALTDRWIDPPFVVMRAEHSLVQLAAARELGLRVPQSVATNDPAQAQALRSNSNSLIAKATSAGIGIAPHADLVDQSMFGLLPRCITLLQTLQVAEADLRVVVVGDRAMTWRRTRRDGDPIDWRAADPAGHGFVRGDVDDVASAAVSVSRRLGLRFSVQDWLLGRDGLIFLEVNPSGQWLFLSGAEAEVADALADELTRDPW